MFILFDNYCLTSVSYLNIWFSHKYSNIPFSYQVNAHKHFIPPTSRTLPFIFLSVYLEVTSILLDNHCPAVASFLTRSYFLPPSSEVHVLNCGNATNAVTDSVESEVFDGLRLGTPLYWWPGNSTMEIVMGTQLFLAVDKDSGPRPYTVPFSNIFFRFPRFAVFLMSTLRLEIE